MNAFLISANASETLRRRAMRLSYHMASVDMDAAVDMIFRADTDAAGQFTEAQYERLTSIADRAAARARAYRESGNAGA